MRTIMLMVALRADLGSGGLGPDKVKHFLLGAFTQSIGYSAARLAGASRGTALAVGSGATVTAGVWKEARDGRRGSRSVADFAWTVAGGAAVSPLLVRPGR